jgi:prophage regulatory protein
MHSLPSTGLLRLPQILGDKRATPPIPAVVPVCRSTWWAGVRTGRYPPPVKHLGPRITAWRVEDIRALLDGQWHPANVHARTHATANAA